MKKFFGVIFLLIALALLGFGIMVLTSDSTRNDTLNGRFGSAFSREYRDHSKEMKLIGAGSVAGGLVFFVIGLVMVSTKSNAQRRKEAELAALRKIKVVHEPKVQTAKTSQPENTAQGKRLYFIHNGTEQEGPFNFEELKQKNITKKTSIWYEGLNNWTAAEEVKELNEYLSAVTPPPFQQKTTTPPPFESPKTESTTKEVNQEQPVEQKTEKPTISEIPEKPKSGLIKGLVIGGILVCLIIITYVVVNSMGNESSGDYYDSSYPEDSYEEKVMTVEEEEAANPLRFLSTTGTYQENFWGDQIKIECEITNNATVAVYKDAEIEFTYYSKSGTALGNHYETVYEKFKPGSTKTFNFRIPNYQDVHEVGWEIVGALAM